MYKLLTARLPPVLLARGLQRPGAQRGALSLALAIAIDRARQRTAAHRLGRGTAHRHLAGGRRPLIACHWLPRHELAGLPE